MTSQWGRKESVVWPPHSPIYSYGALFLAFWAAVPVNRWLIARGRGHAVMHGHHAH